MKAEEVAANLALLSPVRFPTKTRGFSPCACLNKQKKLQRSQFDKLKPLLMVHGHSFKTLTCRDFNDTVVKWGLILLPETIIDCGLKTAMM